MSITIIVHQAPRLQEEEFVAELVDWVEIDDRDEVPVPLFVVRRPKPQPKQRKARITIVVE